MAVVRKLLNMINLLVVMLCTQCSRLVIPLTNLYIRNNMTVSSVTNSILCNLYSLETVHSWAATAPVLNTHRGPFQCSGNILTICHFVELASESASVSAALLQAVNAHVVVDITVSQYSSNSSVVASLSFTTFYTHKHNTVIAVYSPCDVLALLFSQKTRPVHSANTPFVNELKRITIIALFTCYCSYLLCSGYI